MKSTIALAGYVILSLFFWTSSALAGPDLIVQDLWLEPSTLISGRSYTRHARLYNQGSSTASAGLLESQRVAFDLDGNEIGSANYDDVGRSNGETVSLAVVVATPGVHQFRATADAGERIEEDIESNNSLSKTFSFHPPQAVLQLSTVSLDFSYSSVQQALRVWNSGEGTLEFSIKPRESWITASPSSGSCSNNQQTVQVSVDATGLLVGTNVGQLTISSSGGNSSVNVRVVTADEDHDEIPDGWETLYFGSPAGCNPYLDPDEDRQNNRQEWIGGSDPTNKLSSFVISKVVPNLSGKGVALHWTTLLGRSYDVYWSSNALGPFLPVATDLSNTDGTYTDASLGKSGFYLLNAKLR
jgi:hypothetical protein